MRQRNLANRILFAAALLFVAAAFLRRIEPGLPAADLLFLVSEAALIGGIADWFAVTALFRRPLGFPWHTELIPRNQKRLVASVAETVERDLLSPEALQKQLASVSIMERFIAWADSGEGRRALRALLAASAGHFLTKTDAAMLGTRVQNAAGQYLRERIIQPRLASFGEWALTEGRVEQFFLFVLEELRRFAAKPETLTVLVEQLERIRDKQSKNILVRLLVLLGEDTDSLNTKEAAEALQQELISVLDDVRREDHPLHQWALQHMADSIGELADNPHFHEAFVAWADVTAEKLSLPEMIGKITRTAVDILKEWMEEETEDGGKRPYPHLRTWFVGQAKAYWEIFKKEKEIHSWLEDYLRQTLYRLLEKEHHLIGAVAREALENLGRQGLSDFVEEKAGDDLQWIRINGCVVGGIVGLLLFLFLRFFYDPFVVPVVRSWLLS